MPRRWNLEAFRQLKMRWRISIQALLYRAKDLECLSQSTYQRAMIQLPRNKMRKNEGPEWEMERPVLVALELLKGSVTLSELAEELSVYPSELREMLILCVPHETLDAIDRREEPDLSNIVTLRKPQ